ncbi:glycosyltransferase family 4 protein [Chamaesiphon minutus]|uniref:Glycosyltransferase n=1 Tax=Chamaesiphon minutus (strain ATCC 27169 / PCC 6605) TaxID=1173020 RepID=K9UN13_CHAP6|nr:glycosyltransferase family 4 protein [Chamaesiphon minutus]AFY95589.1 glycosyltransferase [Chamaesiphon minutus PCC 6605]
MKLKVVFCWSDISGYMAACWRALQESAEIDVFVIAFQALTETAFGDRLMQGIPSKLLDLQARQDSNSIEQLVLSEHPDVVVMCGWLHQPYCKLATSSKLQNAAFIMGMDTPWKDNLRQRLAPLVLRSFLQRMDRVVVTGERSWQYAKRLGIAAERIDRGLYGIDYNSWVPLWKKRSQADWPRSFLFIGRYIPVKAIDLLVQAYQDYRDRVEDPWDLVCCGQGELKSQLAGKPGIIDRGFLQPTDMESVWQSAGAFILPSRFDPWPLAIVEAAAAGLPIICTDVCGSEVEVVRSWYNGLVIPEENTASITQAFLTFHQHHAELPIWGQRSQTLAAPYASGIWVDRWQASLRIAKVSKLSSTSLFGGASAGKNRVLT